MKDIANEALVITNKALIKAIEVGAYKYEKVYGFFPDNLILPRKLYGRLKKSCAEIAESGFYTDYFVFDGNDLTVFREMETRVSLNESKIFFSGSFGNCSFELQALLLESSEEENGLKALLWQAIAAKEEKDKEMIAQGIELIEKYK